jgi:uncharacterized phage-associated protein
MHKSNAAQRRRAIVSALVVAQHMLDKTGTIPSIKLVKLVCYSQACHMVWSDRRLFPEKIRRWPAAPLFPPSSTHQGHL